jgi:hypothetical protein
MQLTQIFQEQLHLQAVSEHEAPLTALVHILKIETHNPRWQLNRNWDILNSIMHNIHIHQLNWYLGQDDNPVHQHALQTANIHIMEYKAKYPTLPPWQQPTLEYGLAYLCHGSIIINKQYDEEITHAYNWPKFTKHCCEKFLWNTKTFQSVNWNTKGRKWVSTREPTCSNSSTNGYQLEKPLYALTAQHLQYAHHAAQLPRHTTTYSSAKMSTANKSPMIALHKSTKLTANGRSQLKLHNTYSLN